MMNDGLRLIKRLEALESEVLYDTPPREGCNDFCYVSGQLPILLSAPHGAAHLRNGRPKQEDEYTSSFARLVAEETGAQALYVHRQSMTDHNYYPDTPFKLKLKELADQQRVRFVLDLHGASETHNFGIALGMMDGRSCPQQAAMILNAFERYGFSPTYDSYLRVDVDHRFKGKGGARQETITRYVVDRLGLPAAQLEINARLRIAFRAAKDHRDSSFSGDKVLIERIIYALFSIVNALADQI